MACMNTEDHLMMIVQEGLIPGIVWRNLIGTTAGLITGVVQFAFTNDDGYMKS